MSKEKAITTITIKLKGTEVEVKITNGPLVGRQRQLVYRALKYELRKNFKLYLRDIRVKESKDGREQRPEQGAGTNNSEEGSGGESESGRVGTAESNEAISTSERASDGSFKSPEGRSKAHLSRGESETEGVLKR